MIKKADLMIGNFDVVSALNPYNRRFTFKVNLKKYPEHSSCIGKRIGDSFIDLYNQRCTIIDISKNDPYEGLASVLPKFAKDSPGYKPRLWKTY